MVLRINRKYININVFYDDDELGMRVHLKSLLFKNK